MKRRAVEEGMTMVEMLRTLFEEQYGTGPSSEGSDSRGDGTSVKRR